MLKVLCVEDDDDDFVVMKSMLVSRAVKSEEMFFVERADSAEMAENLAAIEHYDLFLVDYYLAEGPSGDTRTGLEFVRTLMNDPEPKPAILVSGYDEIQLNPEEMSWLAEGRVTFLQKQDMDERTLLDAMHRVMRLKLRVLLVDDDEDDFELARSYLSFSSLYRFEIDWAESLEHAYDLLERNPYDVFVVDYHLGEHTGIELAKELSRRGIEKPVLLVSGESDVNMDEEAVRLIGRRQLGFLTKAQISTESLLHAVLRARETQLLQH